MSDGRWKWDGKGNWMGGTGIFSGGGSGGRDLERGMDLGQDFREIGDGMEGSMERWWKIVYMELIFMDYGGIVDIIEDWGDFGWVGIENFW